MDSGKNNSSNPINMVKEDAFGARTTIDGVGSSDAMNMVKASLFLENGESDMNEITVEEFVGGTNHCEANKLAQPGLMADIFENMISAASSLVSDASWLVGEASSFASIVKLTKKDYKEAEEKIRRLELKRDALSKELAELRKLT